MQFMFCRTFVFAALTLPLAAQQADRAAPAAPTSRQGPALTIRTAQAMIARGAAKRFGSDATIPEIEAGQHYVVEVDAGGKAAVTTAVGKVAHLELAAHPGALMAIFQDKIDAAKGMAQGMIVVGLGQAGVKTKDAVKVFQTLFDFPKQIDTLEFKMLGDPEEFETNGIDVELGFTPVAGTWFASLVDGMRLNPQGAPATPGDEGFLRMASAVDAASLRSALQPLLDFVALVAVKSEADRTKFDALMGKVWPLYDGSLAMSWKSSGMQVIAGLTDADAVRKLMDDADYLATMRAISSTPMADTEVTPNAFAHRGVAITRSVATLKDDAPDNPLFVDGTMESFTAVPGGYLAMTMVDAEHTAMTSLIDAILEQKVARAPLADNALMTVQVKVRELMAKVGQTRGGGTGGDAPELVTLALTRSQNRLHLQVHAQ